MAMRRVCRSDEADPGDVSYELRIDDRVFAVRVRSGKCYVSEERPSDPKVVIAASVSTLGALLWHRLSGAQALAAAKVKVDGGPPTPSNDF